MSIKRTADESPERPDKRRRTRAWSSSQTSGPSTNNTGSVVYTAPHHDQTGVTDKRRRRSRNRRRHGRRRTSHPSHQAPTEASSYVRPVTLWTTAPTNSRATFKAKYVQGALLGKGGNGSVFAGCRRHDNLPVAIKHIPGDTRHLQMFVDAKNRMVPLEVALMLKLKPASGGTSGVAALLDWYDQRDELILIVERPVPCVDLFDYVESAGTLQEGEAKIIVKQLVEVLSEIHSKGVFHRDIKPENILCETGPDGPRVRIIDFGSGTFITEGIYATHQGTDLYTSPEWFVHGYYRAEPTTVWQLGAVLFILLHFRFPFQNATAIIRDDVCVRDDLSFDCKDLLLTCLNKSPAARPSLGTLRHHPWLR